MVIVNDDDRADDDDHFASLERKISKRGGGCCGWFSEGVTRCDAITETYMHSAWFADVYSRDLADTAPTLIIHTYTCI